MGILWAHTDAIGCIVLIADSRIFMERPHFLQIFNFYGNKTITITYICHGIRLIQFTRVILPIYLEFVVTISVLTATSLYSYTE